MNAERPTNKVQLKVGAEVEGGWIKDLAGDLEEANTTFVDVHEFPDLRLLLKRI